MTEAAVCQYFPAVLGYLGQNYLLVYLGKIIGVGKEEAFLLIVSFLFTEWK